MLPPADMGLYDFLDPSPHWWKPGLLFSVHTHALFLYWQPWIQKNNNRQTAQMKTREIKFKPLYALILVLIKKNKE